MSLYKNWFTTEMLRDALQGGANSTSKVTFKRMVASEDMVSDQDFPGLTNASMQTIKANQTALISSTKTRDNVVTITSVFNSFKVISEYKMNTVYLVAEYNGREFLAAITSANEPYTMPVESKTEHAEYTFKLQIGISNTQQVDLNMDPEAVATNEQLMDIEKRLDFVDENHEGRLSKLEHTDTNNVKLTSDQQVYGTKTFIEKIIGTINKALSAVKLETPRKINGVDFDGTQDIDINASDTIQVFDSYSPPQDLNDPTIVVNQVPGTTKQYYYTGNRVKNNPFHSDFIHVTRYKLTTVTCYERAIYVTVSGNTYEMSRRVSDVSTNPVFSEWTKTDTPTANEIKKLQDAVTPKSSTNYSFKLDKPFDNVTCQIFVFDNFMTIQLFGYVPTDKLPVGGSWGDILVGNLPAGVPNPRYFARGVLGNVTVSGNGVDGGFYVYNDGRIYINWSNPAADPKPGKAGDVNTILGQTTIPFDPRKN